MLIEDLAAYYISLGLLQGVGIDIVLTTKGQIPRGAGPYASIIDAGGPQPLRSHDARARRPKAQVVVQAALSSVAQAKCEQLFAPFADGVYNATVGGNRYAQVVVEQDIMDLSVAATGRIRFGFNLGAIESGAIQEGD